LRIPPEGLTLCGQTRFGRPAQMAAYDLRSYRPYMDEEQLGRARAHGRSQVGGGALVHRRVRQHRPRLNVKTGMAAAILGVLALAAPLGAAASPISISARPTAVSATNTVRLFGRLTSSQPGQSIQLEMSECGGYGWRVLTHTETTSLGAWEAAAGPNVTTKFRARWRKATSNVVTVRTRPYIFTDNHHHQRLIVEARANDFFERGLLQRQVGKQWVLVRSFAFGRSFVGSTADLHLKLPRGTHVRVVLTQAQVGRCYLPAATTTVLT